jgi:hypothetical protein
MNAAPEGAEFTLKDIFHLHFDPEPIRTKEEAERLLLAGGGTLGPWFEKEWATYEKGASILAINPQGGILRLKSAITFYIKRELPTDNPLITEVQVLRESILLPDNSIQYREFDSTVSESMEQGEHPLGTALRCLREELKIRLRRRHRRRYLSLTPTSEAKHPYFYMNPKLPNLVEDVETGYPCEIYKREKDLKRPGVSTYIRLFHFIWLMPRLFWNNRYIEPHDDKTLIFTWEKADTPRHQELGKDQD